jgi:hypothetical protein
MMSYVREDDRRQPDAYYVPIRGIQEDPVATLVSLARCRRDLGGTNYDHMQKLRNGDPDLHDRIEGGMCHEAGIAQAMVPFLEDGQSVHSIGPELAQSFLDAEKDDLTFGEAYAQETSFYVRIEENDLVSEDGTPLDGFMFLSKIGPTEAEREFGLVLMGRDGIRLSNPGTQTPIVVIDAENDSELVSDLILRSVEGIRKHASLLRVEIEKNKDKEPEPLLGPKGEIRMDQARMRMMPIEADAMDLQADILAWQAVPLAKLIAGTIRMLNADEPKGVMRYLEEAPSDLVAKANAGGSGAKKADQKLFQLGHVKVTRHEIGQDIPEPAAVEPKGKSTGSKPSTVTDDGDATGRSTPSAAVAVADQADGADQGERIAPRRRKRLERIAQEQATQKATMAKAGIHDATAGQVVARRDAEPEEAAIQRTVEPQLTAMETEPKIEQDDETLPVPVHDQTVLEDVDENMRRCFRELPSLDSRNWEVAFPGGLASMLMRRAKVAQMPREYPEATRRRLASDLTPRLEGLPELMRRLKAEQTANPDFRRAYSISKASIMRDVEHDVAAAVVHPIHVVVADEEFARTILFPGVAWNPQHDLERTSVVTAWTEDRTLHLMGTVHQGCLIGLRRIEYDLEESTLKCFDSDSDEGGDALDMLYAPVADAILGPVDEYEAWRYARREVKVHAKEVEVEAAEIEPECNIDEPCLDLEPVPLNPEEPVLGDRDFTSWDIVSRPSGPLDETVMGKVKALMSGNAVARAALLAIEMDTSEASSGPRSAMRRHLRALADAEDVRLDALSSPDIDDDADLSHNPDADGVVVVTDRALVEHATPGILGPLQSMREMPVTVLYRLRKEGMSALMVQVDANSVLNLAQWVQVPPAPQREDDDLKWYLRGAVAQTLNGRKTATTCAASPAPRTLPAIPAKVTLGYEPDMADQRQGPKRVVAQARIHPDNLAIAAKTAAEWFDAQAAKHGTRLIDHRRTDGEWTIEHKSEDRVNPSRWSVTLRLSDGDDTGLDVIVRTTLATGVKPRLPTLIRDIAAATPTRGPDGPLTLQPRRVRTRSDLNELLRELQSPERVLPILLMSQDRDGMYIRDPREIAAQSMGAITVWLIGDDMTYDLAETLGQEYRVFNGAMRLFQPRFDPDTDHSAKHPRTMNDSGAERALSDLISRATSATTTRYAIVDTPIAAPAPAALPTLNAKAATTPAVPAGKPDRIASRPILKMPESEQDGDEGTGRTAPESETRNQGADRTPAATDACTSENAREEGSRPDATDQSIRQGPDPTGMEAPEPARPFLDQAAMARMVEDAVQRRMSELETANALKADAETVVTEDRTKTEASREATDPEAPRVEETGDGTPVEAAAAAPTQPFDVTRFDSRIEVAVAKQFAQLGLTELFGAMTAMIGRMDGLLATTAIARTEGPAKMPDIIQAELSARDEQIAALREEIRVERESAAELLGEAEAERSAATTEVATLRQALNDRRRDSLRGPEDPEAWPKELSKLAEWLERNTLPNVVITAKAWRAMRKVRYTDMERLCRTLQLLDGAYIDMRAGEEGARGRWEDGLKELRLDNKKQTEIGKSIRNGAEYRFEHNGVKYDMDFHIRGIESVHNEHDRLLRIYFAYSKEEGRVLIGHMPTHLTTIDS